MVKIFPYIAGETFGSHKTFLQKLKGAKVVNRHPKSDVVIIFCPIVSRFESDVSSALASASELGIRKVILVAMHHSFDQNYALPEHRVYQHPNIRLLVDCLYFEGKGLLKCPINEHAVKKVSAAVLKPSRCTLCCCCC